MLTTLPSGARTKNRRTPHASVRSGVHDLVAALLGVGVGRINVVDLHRDHRVLGCRHVARDQLDVAPVSGEAKRATHPKLNSSMDRPR